MLRVLFFSSNPSGSHVLNLSGEYRALENRLRADGRSACAALRHVPSGTFDLLERELRSFSPNILHFAGHGSKDALLLEGTHRQRVDMPHDALWNLVRLLGSEIGCVVLNACHSVGQADSLLTQIPSLVGMQAAVADSTAIRFSTSFYAALAAGDALGRAFALALNSTYGTGSPGPDVPAFYHRPGVETLPLVRKLRIFCLHAPADEESYSALRRSLAIYRRAGVIELMGPQNAPSTDDRERFCEDQLDAANLILCMSSGDFLDSDRCAELTSRALRRREAGQAVVINLLVRECAWKDTSLGHMQPLPRSGKFLTPTRKDDWWQEVVTELLDPLRAEESKILDGFWRMQLAAPEPSP